MYWWRVLNDAIFEGELRAPIKIYVRKFRGQDLLGTCIGWGYSKHKPVMIEMKHEYDDRETFLTILAHEMVHQWEQQTYGRMTHGKNFFKWTDKVKSLGLPLEQTY